MTTAYYDDQGNPQLVRSYCVFADFLGFRHEIIESVKRGDEDKLFQRFMQDVEPAIDRVTKPSELEESTSFPRMWDAKVFTDNVVLGYVIWSATGEKEFGSAICDLMEFQLAAVLKGFFIRGGWAVGNLFMNRNTVFGAALLDAYDLETNVAVQPRIVLSEGVKSLVCQQMPRHSNPPHCWHLITDSKGVVATNYLTETINDLDSEIYWEDIEQHRDVVAQRLVAHKSNEKVLGKYQWVAAYHNFFCSLLRDSEDYFDDVMIKGNFPDYGIRLLKPDDCSEPASSEQH